MYGVVHRGVLELFKSQDGYDTGARAVKKVQLRNLHLSLRPQEFHQSATGFISVRRHTYICIFTYHYFVIFFTYPLSPSSLLLAAALFLGLQA